MIRFLIDYYKINRQIRRENAHMDWHGYIMSLGMGNGECNCEQIKKS